MSDLLDRIASAIDRSLTSTGGDPPQVEVLEEFAKWLDGWAVGHFDAMEGTDFMAFVTHERLMIICQDAKKEIRRMIALEKGVSSDEE